jgi:hypothetical protein
VRINEHGAHRGVHVAGERVHLAAQILVAVEVVLRHFHRSCSGAARCGFLWGRHLASWLLALGERSGHEDLGGSDRLSVIPYVYGRTELYCAQAYLA